MWILNTDLADTIRIRYDTHVHDLCFKIKNFGFQQQSECFGLIFTVNPVNTKAKAKMITCVVCTIILFTKN